MNTSRGGVGAFPANNFIFNAGITDFVAVSDEKLTDSFGRESLFSRLAEIGLKILVDLLADRISEDTRALDDLSILGKDLISQSFSYIFDLMHILFRCVPGDAQFTGYSFVGFMEVVQINDSTYICHRFHLRAHLSECLEREGFPSWGGGSKLSRRKHELIIIDIFTSKLMVKLITIYSFFVLQSTAASFAYLKIMRIIHILTCISQINQKCFKILVLP